MLQILKEQKVGILSGITSSAVFLYFIQPILEFLAHLFLTVSNLIGSAFTDRIYQQVAHLETQDYSFVIFMIIIGTQAAVFFGFGLGMLVNLTSFLGLENVKNKITTKNQPKSNISRIMLSCTLILIAFLLTSFLVSNFIQLSTISSFKRHIRIIAPYITEQEEKEIISEWSLIESKKDYQKIYIKINIIAASKGIKLPENKIYSLLSI